MDRDPLDDDRFDGTVLELLRRRLGAQHGQPFHPVQNVESVDQPPEHRVDVVQVGLRRVANEELAPVRVLPLVGLFIFCGGRQMSK